MASNNARSNRIKIVHEQYKQKVNEIAEFGSFETQALTEAFGRVVNDLIQMQEEDEGWVGLESFYGNADSTKGIKLDGAQKVAKYLEEQTKKMGGLLGRGLRLKNNHVFGRGYEFKSDEGEKIKPRHLRVIEDEVNWEAVFSPTALKELNRILFTSGNLFVLYDSGSKEFKRLSIDVDIENAITQEDNRSRINYILRKGVRRDGINGPIVNYFEWVPTFAHKSKQEALGMELPQTIQRGPNDVTPIPVSQTSVIIEKRINKDNGDIWGIPDAFGAAPWAVMYSRYLRDGAKLQSALATIAYLVKAKSQEAAAIAGAKMQQGRVGQVAIGGPATEITQMPKAGAIDLYEGRPLQAQVASNLDVSVTGLAADPGLGGSYASENALSQPEQLAALSRQEDFTDFFRQVFKAIGAPDISIDFRRLDVDPIHRTLQSLNLARELGGVTQREYRDRVTELLDVIQDSKGLPKPDIWVKAYANNNSNAPQGGGTTPGQGQSGTVGPLDDDGNSMANDDKAASEG